MKRNYPVRLVRGQGLPPGSILHIEIRGEDVDDVDEIATGNGWQLLSVRDPVSGLYIEGWNENAQDRWRPLTVTENGVPIADIFPPQRMPVYGPRWRTPDMRHAVELNGYQGDSPVEECLRAIVRHVAIHKAASSHDAADLKPAASNEPVWPEHVPQNTEATQIVDQAAWDELKVKLDGPPAWGNLPAADAGWDTCRYIKEPSHQMKFYAEACDAMVKHVHAAMFKRAALEDESRMKRSIMHQRLILARVVNADVRVVVGYMWGDLS